jgi:hypothetical protein
MDNLYQKLNKKLDTLAKQTQTLHNIEKNAFTFHSRVINLTNTKFTKEQTHTLTLGLNYAIEKEPKQYKYVPIADMLPHHHITYKDIIYRVF